MRNRFLAVSSLLIGVTLMTQFANAQMSTPPATAAEIEALYTTSIENRTEDILKALALTNSVIVGKVHDLIIAQYRVMRSRDDLINAQLDELEKQSKSLHEHFIGQLSKLLTPAQVETVKDKMTYNKVKVTYEAYNNIIPQLTETDKAKIMELLKEAREKAVDGGSATEKSEIFQQYKNQINDYLNAHGHDVAKAYKDWEAKQAAVQASTNASTNVVR